MPRAGSACRVSGAGGWPSSSLSCLPASRSAIAALADAPGHRIRRTRSGVLAAGSSQRRNRARGDGQGAVARRPGRHRGGRARGDGLDRRGRAGQCCHAAAASRRRLAAAAGDAQAHGAAGGRRGESRAGAVVRSRPPHAVSARAALFRRGRRRSRSRTQDDHRRLGRRAENRRRRRQAAGRSLGRVGAGGHSGTGLDDAAAAEPDSARGAAARRQLGGAGRSGCRWC